MKTKKIKSSAINDLKKSENESSPAKLEQFQAKDIRLDVGGDLKQFVAGRGWVKVKDLEGEFRNAKINK